MDERLNSLRSLQQMVCVAAAAVLAFAMTPDRSKEYRSVLAELEALRRISLNKYPDYVQNVFAEQERGNYQLLLRVARESNLPVHGTPTFIQPIVMEVPPQGAYVRLREFESFLLGNHLAGIYLIDHDQRLLAEQLKASLAKINGPVALNGIEVPIYTSYITFSGNVRVLDPSVITNSASNLESIELIVSGPPPPVQPIPLKVTYTFYKSPDPHLALDWLRSEELGRDLIDPKSGELFPHLRPFWERIADMGIDNATLFLQERIEATTRGTLTLFGVSVDRDLVLWVGPAVLSSLMLFFWLHLRHLNASELSESEVESSRDYPWVVCFPYRVSSAVSYCCVVAFPIAACVLLLISHGDWQEPSTRYGGALTLLLFVFSAFATQTIRRFRALLGDKGIRSAYAAAEAARVAGEPSSAPER